MHKIYHINGKEYSIFMNVSESEKKIKMAVCNGASFQFDIDRVLFSKSLKKNIILELLGNTLEKRTSNAMIKLIEKMNNHADKNNKLYKAYNETKEIFTLDEKMNL